MPACDPDCHALQACEISIVVPAYNEARLIAGTLRALHSAVRPSGVGYEILVVDDGSSDATAQQAMAEGAEVIAVANRNIGRTRNAGAGRARGRYLFFVDADTRVDERVMGAALARLRAGDVGGGAVFRWDESHGMLGRAFEISVATVLRWLGLASGCFIFARKDAFEAVGGFDPGLLISEEWSLSWRLRRLGRFRVLAVPVVTSGRKLAVLGLGDALGLAARALLRGPRARRERRFARWWYDDPPR